MLDESCDDLLNHIKKRVLLLGGSDKWDAKLKEQRDKAVHEYPELRLTPYLNIDAYYSINKPLDRWLRLQESIDEIRDYYKIIQLQ